MNKPLDNIICSLEIHKDIQKRTINVYKEKLINWLNKQISICLCDELKEVGKLTAYYKILEFIENGEFDND